MNNRVLAFAEVRDGHFRNVSFEVVSAARRMAGEGKVTAVVFGSQADRLADQLAQYGADEVYTVNHADLDTYITDTYSNAFMQIVQKIGPDVILMGHTSIGKDMGPRVAARLGVGMISDCVQLDNDGQDWIFTRPIYAGKAFQKKKFKKGLIFATIRPNNIAPDVPDPNRTAEVVSIQVEFGSLRTAIQEIVKKAAGGIDLTEAKIIVSGGRGVKGKEGFEPLRELAEVLGAAVGASRGACDAGYCEYVMQIGQTGKVVTPDLYIACGISGAIQHLAGMSNSKVIVAINKDPEAPIFQVADYGIVGDLFEVVPLLTKEFKTLFSQA